MTPRKTDLIRSRLAALVVCASLCFGIGCQSAAVRRSEELESRIRDHQSSIERLTVSLDEAKSDRDMARREASILRDELAKLQPSPEVVQAAHSLARINRIEVVPLLSGGLDRDQIPGDELVSILIAPKDMNGETHRVSGELSVRLRDISLPDGSQVISQSDFNETETETLWHNGIVGRGFRVIVPLPKTSPGGELTAQVRFTDAAGQQFDTIYPLRITPQSESAAASR